MNDPLAISRPMVDASGSVFRQGDSDAATPPASAVCSRNALLPISSRLTRLDVLTHAIALALGGRPGERLADRMSMPVSVDMLLHILRRRATSTLSDVRVVGINDFAWLKGQRYGTIIRDFERRCTIDLLPDGECGTVAVWLAAHAGVEIVCRDRGGGFREGATKGAFQALQICDRWHLLENATAAFVEAVKRHIGELRRAITGGNIDPEVLSSAERVR